MSDDIPTKPFETPGDGDPAARPDTGDPRQQQPQQPQKSRGLLIALIVIGALLLIALIIVLIVLLRNGKPDAAATTSATATASETPSTSAVPTPTPTPTVTPTTPPPPSTSPAITGYSISPAKLDCSAGTPNLSIKWSSVNGAHAYFGVNTADAMTGGMGWELPPTGSDADFPDGYRPYPAQCGNDSTEYTITILGTDGTKVSKKFTVSK